MRRWKIHVIKEFEDLVFKAILKWNHVALFPLLLSFPAECNGSTKTWYIILDSFSLKLANLLPSAAVTMLYAESDRNNRHDMVSRKVSL